MVTNQQEHGPAAVTTSCEVVILDSPDASLYDPVTAKFGHSAQIVKRMFGDSEMKLRVAGRILVKRTWWDLDRPVLDARLIGGHVIVIYDHASYPKERPAPNLVAFNLKQEILWVADNPTEDPTDGYTEFLSENPLKVANYSGLYCRIDLETGRIKKILFAS